MSPNRTIDPRHPNDESNLPQPQPPRDRSEPDSKDSKPEPPDNEPGTSERPDLDWAEHED